MKKETEEIIDWIKKQMSLAKDCRPVWGENHKAYNKDFEAAVAFLDSFPEIEKRLCLGGYIRDFNGTPCCHGDRVTFFYGNNESTHGILIWNTDKKRFMIALTESAEKTFDMTVINRFYKI